MDPKAIESIVNDQLPKMARITIRAELKRLPSVIIPGETLRYVAAGQYRDKQGLLALTDRRVIFLEAGMMRQSLEDFALSRISAVGTRQQGIWHSLHVHVSGSDAEIEKIAPPQRADEIANAIRQVISGGSTPTPTTVSAPQPDSMSKLQQAKQMLESGLISEAEYNDIRQRILSSM